MITLHPGEEILLERRQYWLPIAAEGVSMLVLAFIPLVAILALDILPTPIHTFIRSSTPHFLFFAAAWMLAVWVVFSVTWTNYYLDVLLVTSKRVIDIQQIGLFARDLAELRLENIEDMRVEIVGFLPSLLGFGNIYLQTASETREFVVRNIPDPHAVRDIISRCHENVVRKEKDSQTENKMSEKEIS